MFETNYVAGGRLDAPHYPTFQIPFIVGNNELALAGNLVELNYIVPFTGELYAVSIDCETYQNDDNWDLYVEGVLICEKIYVKRAPEGVNLMAFIPVFPGQKITVKFRNMGAEKVVWCSLHFLKEGLIAPPPPVIPPIEPPIDPPEPPGTMPPISVSEGVIRLHLYDTQAVDGDIVNIYLNGALIKENFYLYGPSGWPGQAGVDYVEVPLQMGDNLFVFEGVSAGNSGELTGMLKIGDAKGNLLYDAHKLPSLLMERIHVDEPSGIFVSRPRVQWTVTRNP